MAPTLKILHLEDTAFDAELVEFTLKRAHLAFDKLLVDNKTDFVHALHNFSPDIVLSDHSLPSFNSREALRLLKESGLPIPFILITATISEEFAVEIMKEGAADYILKDRMQRLPNAILNVLEKYRSDQERDRTSQELNLLFNTIDEVFFSVDSNRRITRISPACESIFGYTPAEFLSDPRITKRIFLDEDRHIRQATKDSLSIGETVFCQYRIRHKDGSIRWVESKIIPNINDSTRTPGYYGIARDITEKKQADLERDRITADLLQRNKDLEQFTYIVSHNLRAPVANIQGLADMMIDLGSEERVNEATINALATSVRNLDRVIYDLNHILQVSSEANDTIEKVSLPLLVEEIRSGITHLIRKNNAVIECDFGNTAEIMALKGYLYSIFYNLIVNSIKYRSPEREPVIQINSRWDGSLFFIFFTDNGKGIDLERYGQHLFGLYKRFDLSVEGKGMGLFMVKMQVERIGGTISIESTPGVGTQFKLEFPRDARQFPIPL